MKYRIALILYNVKNLQIGGGLERQFTNYYKFRKNKNSDQIELFLFTDKGTYAELNKIKFKIKDNVVISLGSYTTNILLKTFYVLFWNIHQLKTS